MDVAHRAVLPALTAAAAVVASIAIASAPGAVQARQRATVELISTTVVMTVTDEPSITICADETRDVEVVVQEEVVYRWTNDAPGVTHRSQRPLNHPAPVRARSSGNAVSITPPVIVSTPPGGTATFTVKGENPGQGELYFDAAGVPHTHGLTVIVKECSYKVTARGRWEYSGRGFNPTLFSTLTNLELKRQSAGVYYAEGTVSNSGYGAPVSGCQPTITVSNTQISVRGDIIQGQNGQEMKLTLSWSTIPAGMVVTCPRVPGRGTSTDVANVAIIVTNMKAWDFSSKVESGHLGVSKLGTVASDTYLALELVQP